MQQKQQTLKKSISFTGKGLHTGLQVEMTIAPAEANHGIKFQRIDLPEQPIIEAFAENVTANSRGTTLEKNGVKISTIEHVLAALSGMGVDNALITVNAPEAPIMDGSARAERVTGKESGDGVSFISFFNPSGNALDKLPSYGERSSDKKRNYFLRSFI